MGFVDGNSARNFKKKNLSHMNDRKINEVSRECRNINKVVQLENYVIFNSQSSWSTICATVCQIVMRVFNNLFIPFLECKHELITHIYNPF